MTIQHFIGIYRERTHHDASIKSASKERRNTAIKAVVTTWSELPGRDIRRLTGIDCREWAAKALREGTGFIAPNLKTRRKGMAGHKPRCIRRTSSATRWPHRKLRHGRNVSWPWGSAARDTEIYPTSVNGRPETPNEGKRGSARVTWWELFKRKHRTTNSGARRGSAADVLIEMLIEEIKPAARWCTWATPMSSNHEIEALSFASAAGNSGRVWRRATG
jgi:hypothetical protein